MRIRHGMMGAVTEKVGYLETRGGEMWTGNLGLTLDGGVVLVDEVALDELDGKCRLADTWAEEVTRVSGKRKLPGRGKRTTTADDDKLVFAEELRLERNERRAGGGVDGDVPWTLLEKEEDGRRGYWGGAIREEGDPSKEDEGIETWKRPLWNPPRDKHATTKTLIPGASVPDARLTASSDWPAAALPPSRHLVPPPTSGGYSSYAHPWPRTTRVTRQPCARCPRCTRRETQLPRL